MRTSRKNPHLRSKNVYKRSKNDKAPVKNMKKVQNKFHNVKEVNDGEHAYCLVKVSHEKPCGNKNIIENCEVRQDLVYKSSSQIDSDFKDLGTCEGFNEGKYDKSIIFKDAIVNNTLQTGIVDGILSNECEIDSSDGDQQITTFKESSSRSDSVWSPVNHSFGKRKLHKSFIISWGTQISCFGFAKCLIETCNFISLSLQAMQEHYKICDGIQNYDSNVCLMCNSWLPTDDELKMHKSKCKGKDQSDDNCFSSDVKNRISVKDTGSQSSVNCSEVVIDSSSCDYSQNLLKIEESKKEQCEISKNCEHCSAQNFLSESEYLLHIALCNRDEDLSVSINNKKDQITCASRLLKKKMNQGFDESCIIQPGRDIPKEQYLRRRGHTRRHRTIWEAAIKKYNHVKCIFQNCHFLALSVEDMISHFGYCNGDGSFAKFVCPYCRGRVTSEKILEIHIERSHLKDCDRSGRPTPDAGSSNDVEYLNGHSDVRDSQSAEVKRETLAFDEESVQGTGESILDEELRENYVISENEFSNCGNGSYQTNSEDEGDTRVSDDGALSDIEKIQTKNKMLEKDRKNDHIYFKKETKNCQSVEPEPSLLGVRNANLRYYSGPRSVCEKPFVNDDVSVHEDLAEEEETDQEQLNPLENEIDSVDNDGKYVRQKIKFSFPSVQTTKRKVRKYYTYSWGESIKTNGFARCLVATCNFISLDIFHIQNHFRTCDGVPAKGPNLCTLCNSWLPSAIELSIHTSRCKAIGAINFSSPQPPQQPQPVYGRKDDDIKITPRTAADELKETDGFECEAYDSLDVPDTTTEATNGETESISCDMSVENIELNCSNRDSAVETNLKKRKNGSLRISDIIKLKKNKDVVSDKIIQSGPVLPEGQYMRRRAYTKQHKAIWESTFEKHKYVKCVFQNCHFLAMSIEDMIYHFGYCIGDGSFAKFECSHCGGRLTTQEILDVHVRLSHPKEAVDQTEIVSNGEGVIESAPEAIDIVQFGDQKEIKTYGKNVIKLKMMQQKNTEDNLESLSSGDKVPLNQRNLASVTNCESNLFEGHSTHVDEDNHNSVSNEFPCNFALPEVGLIVNSKDSDELLEEMNKGNCKTESCFDSLIDEKCANRGNEMIEKRKVQIEASNGNNNDDRDLHEIEACDSRRVIGCKKTKYDEENVNENESSKKNLHQENDGTKEKQNLKQVGDELQSNGDDEVVNGLISESVRPRRGRKMKSKPDDFLMNEECDVKDKSLMGTYQRRTSCNQVQEGNNDAVVESERLNRKDVKAETGEASVDSDENPKKTPRRRGRPPRNAGKETPVDGRGKEPPQETLPPGKSRRGRKRKMDEDEEVVTGDPSEEVKCAKCGLKTQRRQFSEHNFRKHVGLSWIEGEEPVDLDDEDSVTRNVKQAFKYVKSATCENCDSVKRSALGFISHIQNCGKSQEEKDALKIKCPYCPSRILKYSLPVHLKNSHFEMTDEGRRVVTEDSSTPTGHPTKRKSAINAVNKFHEALKQCDDEEDLGKKANFVLYEKDVSKLPKLPFKIRGLWNKMRRENKKIPCRRGSCLAESSTVQEARRHHFLCPELPDRAYICLMCDYYAIDVEEMRNHVDIHSKLDGDFSVCSEDERMEEEVESQTNTTEESVHVVERKIRPSESSLDEGALHKTKFFARENILNERKKKFFTSSLRLTLESEMNEKSSGMWPELHTKAHDWIPFSPEEAEKFLPILRESVAFKVQIDNKPSESAWKKLMRFHGDVIEGSSVAFTGGSILSMSWCKVSCSRSLQKATNQFLAVSSSRKMKKFQDVHEVFDGSFGFIQIWNFGSLNTFKLEKERPRMVMGIVHESGEVWDLSWCPVDAYEERQNEKNLTRLGLLGAACQDGTIRVWSICDPEELDTPNCSPLYKVEPSVILELEDKSKDGCLRLAFGRSGIIVGAYTSGIVAVWSLSNISSPFCKKSGKSSVLKPHLSFQAHRTSITALSICPNSDRYITTAGLDRFTKFWDLECVAGPFESVLKEVCLDNVWPKHWPVTISTFEDVVPCSSKVTIKSIRDAFCEKHRSPLAMNNTCWSLSFNEWMNILCGCNNVGEVKIRFLRNMFLTDEYVKQRNGLMFSTTDLRLLRELDGKKQSEPRPVSTIYEEAEHFFGLVFTDYSLDNEFKTKHKEGKGGKKDVRSAEEYPITSANKVSWNPNLNSFTHLAVGHHCGLIRIRNLVDAKNDQDLIRFNKEVEQLFSNSNETPREC